MTDSNKDTFPLWQKIIYAILVIIVAGFLLWGADKIGLIGFLAGTGF